MNSKRLYQILIGVIGLLALLSIASVYYGQKMLEDKSAELAELKIKTAALDEQERSLVQAKKEIQEYALLETVAKSIVPQEKDQARTVREIVAIAENSGIDTGGLTFTFPSSELGSEKALSGNAITQLDKVDGIPGLSQLEISVSVGEPVSYETIIDFLSGLEQNRRTSAISSVVATPELNGSLDFLFRLDLTLQVYIKP